MGSYENLDIWKMAIDLGKRVRNKLRDFPFDERFEICSQLKNSSESVSSNISEGYKRKSRKEFLYFLNVALASLGEANSQLFLSKKVGYIKEDEYKKFRWTIIKLDKKMKGYIKYIEEGGNW